MNEIILLIAVIIVLALLNLRSGMIKSFKISYYEAKLNNRGVDISKVKNITLYDIWKL